MAEILNLRQARKRKARQASRDEGDRNAAKHGRPKADRDREAAEAERVSRVFEAHRRDREDAPD